jgi:hypothetical protein
MQVQKLARALSTLEIVSESNIISSPWQRQGELLLDASYQDLVHLAKRFQRRRFKNISQSETRIACGGHVC